MMLFGKKLEQLREDVIKYIKWKLDEKEMYFIKNENIYDSKEIIFKNEGKYSFSTIGEYSYIKDINTVNVEKLCFIADAIQFYGIETIKDKIEK